MVSYSVRLKNFLWRQALKHLVRPNKLVKVHGHKMHLDSKDSLLLSLRKNYEPKHVKLLRKTVKPGDYVVDIGAHIGYYTLILANLVGPKGKVYSFEPNPENFKILKKNVEANGYNNVVLEQKAVSNKKGKIKLYLSEINTGDSRIHKVSNDKSFRHREFNVDSVSLDSYFKNIKGINFFKMDIQGAEPLALEGMKNFLKSKNLKFTMEFSPENLHSFGFKPEKILNTLSKEGYTLVDLDKQRLLSPNQFKNLVRHYEKINYFTTIYAFKK